MKIFYRYVSIIIALCFNLAAENHTFTDFSHDRVQDAVKKINELYATKNRTITAQVVGIGSLATLLGVYLYKQNESSQESDITLENLLIAIQKQNSISSKIKRVTTSSLGTGIAWCLQDIWKQCFNKPEYAYFKKSFYNFDQHLRRIKDAAEECETQKDPKNLEYFRAELIVSFNDMVNSLEEIMGVINFLSKQEDTKSERIVFYKEYLIKQVGFLATSLDSLLMQKEQEGSFIAVSKDGTSKIHMTLTQLIMLYPALSEVQKEVTMAQRIQRTEYKVDALVNFLAKQEEIKE